jgi:predicted outer membrane repeat protein
LSNAASKGGAIYAESSARIDLTQNKFNNNNATTYGAAIYLTNTKTEKESQVLQSNFTSNYAASSGSFYLLESKVSATDVRFDNNTTGDQSAGMVLVLSELIMDKSNFSN